jgi:hypothetical protein
VHECELCRGKGCRIRIHLLVRRMQGVLHRFRGREMTIGCCIMSLLPLRGKRRDGGRKGLLVKILALKLRRAESSL